MDGDVFSIVSWARPLLPAPVGANQEHPCTVGVEDNPSAREQIDPFVLLDADPSMGVVRGGYPLLLSGNRGTLPASNTTAVRPVPPTPNEIAPIISPPHRGVE